jgi:hypothetical protein
MIGFVGLYNGTGHRRQFCACALRAGELRLHTRSEYVIFIDFHCNKGYKKAHKCYVIPTLSALFSKIMML